jgi:glutathione synthase/RimK-type ligase-like ATP-grasp enzyme
MKIRNDERLLVEAVASLAEEKGFGLTRLSHDWILVLDAAHRQHTVFGYDIGLNSSTALRVCNDKAASFEVLSAAGIRMIEHRLFLEPIMHRFTGAPGNWTGILTAFSDFEGDVVVKANEGTSGNDVHRIRNTAELERVVHLLLQSCRSIAVSPFVPLVNEKRFVLLDGEIMLAYSKDRPSAPGDGTRSLRELAAIAMTPGNAEGLAEWLAEQTPGSLDRIPPVGEVLNFGWRHNLGHGGRADVLDPSSDANLASAALAKAAAVAVDLRFGSVDVVEPEDGGAPLIMEVNAGVMLEHFGQGNAERRTQALAIYTAALNRALGE